LASTSKIPPEFSEAAAQVRDGPFDLVEAFGFHGCPSLKPVIIGRRPVEDGQRGAPRA